MNGPGTLGYENMTLQAAVPNTAPIRTAINCQSNIAVNVLFEFS
jgi:hypothetical protein